MSFDKPENVNGTSPRKVRQVNASVASIQQEYREIIPAVLRREPRSAKVIALFAGATPRAVENWREGFNGPSVPHFIALAREIPELKAKLLEWVNAQTGDSGDDPTKVLDEIQRLLISREKRK